MRWLAGHEIAAALEGILPGAVAAADDVACYVQPEVLAEACRLMRDDAELDFVHLANLCGVDFWDHLEVVYHVQSLAKLHIGTLKVRVPDREKASVPSVVPVWHGAWMQECETYDLFGVRFEGHPNLHRILLWDGFPGHPLRKDFLSMPGGLQPGLNEFSGTARREAPPVREVR